MRIFDISRPISEDSIIYSGDLPSTFHQENQGQYLVGDLHLSSHTGTHIDAPSHYHKTGDIFDTIPLPCLKGKCRMLDVTRAGTTITANHLKGKLDGVSRILHKMSFSGTELFDGSYPALTLDAAHMITARGMNCVGIDSPSIESYGCDGSVHRKLLSCKCIIIELLDLSDVEEGDYDMVALPLRLKGLDGSPARVVLIERNGEE